MTDTTRETIQSIGESLAAFMKTGAQSENHREEIKKQISETVQTISATVEQATNSYKQDAEDFIENVIRVKGMPTRQIRCNDQSSIVNSSGSSKIAQNFDALLPTIKVFLVDCVATYRLQVGCYFDQQLDELHSRLDEFLGQVPSGGTKDKAVKSKITELKQEIRHFVKWYKLFNVYKAQSLASEIQYIFSLQGNPLAAIWLYNRIDEQGEYRKTYDHKIQDGNFYAVQGNWAIEKGLMRVGPHGYINDSSRPAQEIGCMCRLQWVYNLRDLPGDLLTTKGQSVLERTRSNIAVPLEPQNQKLASSTDPDKIPRHPKSWLARLFSRG